MPTKDLHESGGSTRKNPLSSVKAHLRNLIEFSPSKRLSKADGRILNKFCDTSLEGPNL